MEKKLPRMAVKTVILEIIMVVVALVLLVLVGIQTMVRGQAQVALVPPVMSGFSISQWSSLPKSTLVRINYMEKL